MARLTQEEIELGMGLISIIVQVGGPMAIQLIQTLNAKTVTLAEVEALHGLVPYEGEGVTP